MNRIFIFLLIVSVCSTHAMDNAYAPWELGNHELDDYQRVYIPELEKLRSVLEPIGAWYEPVPTCNAPLDKAKVMNSFWLTMEGKSQEEKDAAFKKYALDGYRSYIDSSRSVKRYQIAAGVYVGANPNVLLDGSSALREAALHNDYPLVELLLKYNADPNMPFDDYDDIRPLKYAKNKKMASLLVAHGAVATLCKTYSGENLLDAVLTHNYAPDLINYYISLGVSYDECDKCGDTPLDSLVFQPPKKITKYIQAFLSSGVPQERLLAVFEKRIQKSPNENAWKENYQILVKLISNKQEIDQPVASFNRETDCLICFTENIDTCIIPCSRVEKHVESICTACLARIKDCPLCRIPLK